MDYGSIRAFADISDNSSTKRAYKEHKKITASALEKLAVIFL